MAWYEQWTRAQRLLITVPAGTVSSLAYFPVVITETSLPVELTNNTYGRVDGQDLAFATDLGVGSSLSSIGYRIPCEIVSCVFGGSPSGEVHVQVPNIAAAGTPTYIWVLYGNPNQKQQPSVNSPYGKYSLWTANADNYTSFLTAKDYLGVWHLSNTMSSATYTLGPGYTSSHVSSVAGVIGGGQSFDYANGGFIKIGVEAINDVLDGAAGCTVEAWVKINAFYNTVYSNVVLCARIADASIAIFIYFTYIDATHGYLSVSARSMLADAMQVRTSTTIVGTGSFVHVAGVVDYAANTITPYINGVASNGGAVAFGNTYYALGTGITYPDAIGARSSGVSSYAAGEFFNGTMDELKVTRVARSVSWMSASYANQNAPATFTQLDGSPLTSGSPVAWSRISVAANRVKETTTSTGTTTINLEGAVSGYQNFLSAVGSGNRADYVIDDNAGNVKVGMGTVTTGSPPTLSRDSVIWSTNSNNLVVFSAGTKTVFNGPVEYRVKKKVPFPDWKWPNWSMGDNQWDNTYLAYESQKTAPYKETISYIPYDLSNGTLWFIGATLAPNKCLYFMPYGEGCVMKLDTTDDSLSYFGQDVLYPYRNWTYNFGVLATNECVYGIPYGQTFRWIVKIDTKTDTVSLLPVPPGGGEQWWGGVLAPSGIIYGAPMSGTWGFLKINPQDDSVSILPPVINSGTGYRGAMVGPDGYVYCGCYGGTPTMLKLNPATEQVVEVPISIATGFRNSTPAPNGSFYSSPYLSSQYFRVNPNDGSAALIGSSANGSMGIILAPNGCFYMGPWNNPGWLGKIDYSTDTLSWPIPPLKLDARANSGVLGPNGAIYFAPFSGGTDVIKLQVSDPAVPLDMNFCLSRYFHKP